MITLCLFLLNIFISSTAKSRRSIIVELLIPNTDLIGMNSKMNQSYKMSELISDLIPIQCPVVCEVISETSPDALG
jgi:hypothetical protein